MTVFNRLENLPGFFERVEAQTHSDFRILLIDHGTRQVDASTLPSYVTRLKGTPDQWWTAAINQGLRHLLSATGVADADYVLLMTDDVSFGPGLIGELIAISEAEQEAVVSAITIDKRTKLVVDADNHLSMLRAEHVCPNRGKRLEEVGTSPIPCNILKGRCVLYPVKVVKAIGLLDERLRRRSDPEWAYRASKRGYRVLLAPSAVVETVIDTDVFLSGKISLKQIKEFLLSPRSTANLPDAWVYFLSCVGGLPGLYCATLYTARSFGYLAAKWLLSRRPSLGRQGQR